MSKINVRSPYYIKFNATNLTQVDLELYIYTGEQITDRTNYYSLTSFAVTDTVIFDIAEIVRDFLITDFDGDYVCTNVWVDYRSKNYIQGAPQAFTNYTLCTGFNGYGYYEEGVNPINDSGLLQSNTKILKLDDASVVIPVNTSNTNNVTYELNGNEIYSKAITPSSPLTSSTQIEYVSSVTNGSDDFQDRVIQDGGTLESSICLEQFLDRFILFNFDTIYVDTTNGVIKIDVENITECKYTPHKVTFVNKFGALQDVWFFKTFKELLTTNKETFKRNNYVPLTNSYNIGRHQETILNKNGNEKLELNSGYYPEEYNEVFTQMLLSEECWIEMDNKTLPINIASSDMSFKTHLNDKLIAYKINVDYSFDKINNVR